MRLHRKPFEDVDINVGSFADIAFLLIIFFILATTLLRPQGRHLQIPSSTHDPEKQNADQITIVLVANEIHYGKSGRLVTIDQLHQQLAEEKLAEKPDDERVIVVESKPTVPYEQWYQVVSAVAQAGGIVGMIEQDETVSKEEQEMTK